MPWTAVREKSIVWQTGKSRGRKTVAIPMTPQLTAALAATPRRGITILTSSDGLPRKVLGSGLASAIRRALLAVIEHVQKVHGPDAPAPLEGLRLHDLRGTAATFFLQAGIEEKEVADLLGWDIERVHEIAKRYVSADAIAEGMLAKLEFKNRKKT
jgi:integrase